MTRPPLRRARVLPPAPVARAAGLAIALFASACHRGVEVIPPGIERSLNHIQTTTPGALSGAAPLPLAEVATRPVDEPPATRPVSEEVPLTLAEVRAAALANNLDLRAELVNRDIAATVVDEEQARFEAVLFGGARHARSIAGGSTESQAYDLGLEVPLRTGGVASVVVPFDRRDAGEEHEAGLQFSISQPLLRGAGFRTSEHSIRVAQYEKAAIDARTKLEAIRILADADRLYWLLYGARAELAVRRQQYELALRQLNEAKLRVAARAAARIEITRAESGLAARLEEIIVAETFVRRRERDLKRVMNRPDLPVGSTTGIVPATDPAPVRLDLDPDRLSAQAVANRMELLELELRLAADASEIAFRRNQALPLFVLDYTYSVAGTDTRANRAFETAADLDDRQSSIGVRAEVPIGNAAARARLSRAILQRLQRLATRDLRRLTIEQEARDVADQVNQNWERILAARNEARLSARTYEAERRQFELNARTSTDVLDAAARLADAQSREVRALADYEIALVDLAYATGTLLGRGRIMLDDAGATDADAIR